MKKEEDKKRRQCWLRIIFILLGIAAVICLVVDVIAILGAIDDTTFDLELEPWSRSTKTKEL